jgi:prepilin-type processing-associated H-X9-DG protein
VKTALVTDQKGLSYVANGNLLFGKSLNVIKSPSNVAIVQDYGWNIGWYILLRPQSSYDGDSPSGDARLTMGENYIYGSDPADGSKSWNCWSRHAGGTTLVYADGHAKWMKWTTLSSTCAKWVNSVFNPDRL